jgi:hypothetical protein
VRHQEERLIGPAQAPVGEERDAPESESWGGGIAAGELRLEELLPDLVRAQLELHREYVLELRPLDEETTKAGGEAMKPGWKTTEFWITLATALASLFAPMVPDQWRAPVAGAAGVAYTISRGIAKAGAAGPTGPG